MPDIERVAYNVCAFLCSLFVLEKGADIFVDHTALLGKRAGIPQGLVALLTAGAEWEELAVVVISVARHRSSLALGNVVGSSISNILGAFSLGLLLLPQTDQSSNTDLFDRSSRIYTLLLLALTALVSVLLAVPQVQRYRKVLGGVLCGVFAVYIASIAYFIQRGVLAEPEDSDSDSDSDSDDGDDAHSDTSSDTGGARERDALISSTSRQPASYGATTTQRRSPRHGSLYHLVFLILGFLAILLSSFVLSEAATGIVDALGLSDMLFGVVILSISTTLPEKFIAITAGRKSHLGILCANTVGSNIFLVTLCLGVTWAAAGAEQNMGQVTPLEIATLMGSAVLMAYTVLYGQRYARSIGVVMLVLYLGFIVSEFWTRR